MGTIDLPVVLIQGLGDNPKWTGTWKLVERTLRETGVQYFIPTIKWSDSFHTIAERTAKLVAQIKQKYPNREVHLFGHSMGGLNARQIAAQSSAENGFTVKTVTTFGTPHHGVKALGQNPLLAKLIRGLQDLTYDSVSNFNKNFPDNPTVKYFSWAGYTDVATLPEFVGQWIATSFYGHTDSLVNTDSAEWGTHLGTVRGLDHLSILNQSTVTATFPHLAAAERGQVVTVVPIDNNLLKVNVNAAEGLINNFLAPQRALMDKIGLRF